MGRAWCNGKGIVLLCGQDLVQLQRDSVAVWAGPGATAPSRRMHQSVFQVLEHSTEVGADDDDGPHQGLGARNLD